MNELGFQVNFGWVTVLANVSSLVSKLVGETHRALRLML